MNVNDDMEIFMIDDLEGERKRLVLRIEKIDVDRRHLKAAHDRDSKARSVKLFEERCEVRKRLGDINALIKDKRRADHGVADDNLGRHFINVARDVLDRDLYEDIMGQAMLRGGAGVVEEIGR